MTSKPAFHFPSPALLTSNLFRSLPKVSPPCLLVPRPLLTPRCLLSDLFPLPDLFQRPAPVFLPPPLALGAYRADLLGALLYAGGFYLGFSQRARWGEALREALAARLGRAAGGALHGVPFVLLGVLADGSLRGAAGGTWALAGAVACALWGGVFEAARAGAEIDHEEAADWDRFRGFATRRIRRSGRCHLSDVIRAFREDHPLNRRGGSVTDAQIRKFVRKWAPGSRRSPNDFYRGLSVIPKGSKRDLKSKT